VELSTLDLSTLTQRFAAQHKVLDEAKLRNLRLIQTVQGKDYPSYGLLILLGYFEHVSTQCARFKGTDMQVFLDRKEYTGDLFAQLENSEMFIKNHLFLRGEVKGLQRTDSLEIPESAIREALVNAYVHRDYSNFGRNIKIGIYDDVLNIVSAGGFPNTLTVQDLAQGRSEIRNRVLARVFKALDYIEQWGSGLQRIKQVCVAQGLLEPKIQESGDFVDVEFYRPTHSVAAQKTVENEPVRTIPDNYEHLRTITDDYGRLAIEQQQILLYLLAHNTMSRKDVVERVGVEKTKAHVLLSGLLELGLITRQGQGRATVYVLAQKNG
jgi:ATP-dependent DNA helicase RecG